MKKLILSLIFTAAAFTAFAFQATVVSTKGKTEVQNGTTWVTLKEGDSLDQGSVIQTGFKSELVLKIKESTVTVSPLSRITLKTLAEREGINGEAGKDETTIFLDTGSLKSNVQKSADRRVGFTVKSPVATASVRGTEFGFASRYKRAKLSTTRGSVAFWKAKNNKEAEGTEDAPVNAVMVSQGEVSNSTAAGVSKPSETAKESAVSLGSGTQTASSQEAGTETSSTSGGSKEATILVELIFE
ncbi:FecR domain-containing protein [Treponema sp.]|uniref:FecR domain-containing protein n=1 Tax=Treponema sp. TaxID=166 RepID=UPI00388D9D83